MMWDPGGYDSFSMAAAVVVMDEDGAYKAFAVEKK
jgi:hypothetical protein